MGLRVRTPTLWLTVAVSLAVTLAGCRDGDGEAPQSRPRDDRVVVASFNFPESRLLAEIYAGAMEAAGIPVRRELDLGPRELVQPALLGDHVDFVPEYLGTALASLDPSTAVDRTDVPAMRAALDETLRRWRVESRPPAGAQNQNGFAVSRATASRLGLERLSDLAPVAAQLTVGGPTECPQRPYCLLGLKRVYGIEFGRFLPFDTEPQRLEALDQGVIDVAVVFSTDGELATGEAVLLDDDRRMQPAENVTPVLSARARARYGDRLTDAIDAVSAHLSTNSLVFLNWRVAVAGKDVAAEARGWLRRQGLLHDG